MGDYDVVIEEVRSCGVTALAAGEDTRAVDLAAAVAGIGPALPDTASALAADTLCTAWETRVRLLGNDVVRLSADLCAAADEYARNEQAAEAALDDVSPRYRRFA